MSKTIWVGAVAYDPKVVTIWEGMRRYFYEEAHIPIEVLLFQSYEMQLLALLAQASAIAPRIDIAWNTNLAYLQAEEWSGHACRAIAMRDTGATRVSLRKPNWRSQSMAIPEKMELKRTVMPMTPGATNCR